MPETGQRSLSLQSGYHPLTRRREAFARHPDTISSEQRTKRVPWFCWYQPRNALLRALIAKPKRESIGLIQIVRPTNRVSHSSHPEVHILRKRLTDNQWERYGRLRRNFHGLSRDADLPAKTVKHCETKERATRCALEKAPLSEYAHAPPRDGLVGGGPTIAAVVVTSCIDVN